MIKSRMVIPVMAWLGIVSVAGPVSAQDWRNTIDQGYYGGFRGEAGYGAYPWPSDDYRGGTCWRGRCGNPPYWLSDRGFPGQAFGRLPWGGGGCRRVPYREFSQPSWRGYPPRDDENFHAVPVPFDADEEGFDVPRSRIPYGPDLPVPNRRPSTFRYR